MSINERDLTRFLRKPFAVFGTNVGSTQPANQSFYTEAPMTFSFNGEWVKSKAYGRGGILFTVRKDLASWEMIFQFSVKETSIDMTDILLPGTEDSIGTTFTFDGTDVSNRAWWFESLFDDDGKICRFWVPKGKPSEPTEAAAGEAHVLWPTQVEALYDPADVATYPTLYIEA